MTLDVYRGRKTTKQTNKQTSSQHRRGGFMAPSPDAIFPLAWKYRRTGYVRFSSLGQNKMSAYCVYDLKSCRSYMIRLIIKGR